MHQHERRSGCHVIDSHLSKAWELQRYLGNPSSFPTSFTFCHLISSFLFCKIELSYSLIPLRPYYKATASTLRKKAKQWVNYLSWKLAGEIKCHTAIQPQMQEAVLWMVKPSLAFRKKESEGLHFGQHIFFFFKCIFKILGNAWALRDWRQIEGNRADQLFSVDWLFVEEGRTRTCPRVDGFWQISIYVFI